MSFFKALLVFCLGFGISAQAAQDSEIIQHLSHNVILATYSDLAVKTKELKIAVTAFKEKPNQRNLRVAQKAWKNARTPWELSESFIFGPVDALGIDPLLDTWPLNTKDINLIAQTSQSMTPDFLRDLGTNLQGFHTIEYLLFGDGLYSNTRSSESFTEGERDYLYSAAVVLAEHASELAYAWSHNYDPENPQAPGYVHIISNPSTSNPIYTSERAVMEEFIQGMIGIVDEVANAKMAEAMGEDIHSADPSLLESPFSWNSINDFKNNIRSVQHIYTGSYKKISGPGVKDLVSRVNPELAQSVDAQIKNCIQLIDASRPKKGDFAAAIKDEYGRKKIKRAIEALNKLQATLEEQVLPILNN